VVLAASTIAANARFFGNDFSQVPKVALTVGVGTIMDAREVCIIATGRAKAEAVKEGVEGAISGRWTITKLQDHPSWWLCIDSEAANGLKSETIEVYYTP
jgi:glucosamine-6-phosphate deaminase